MLTRRSAKNFVRLSVRRHDVCPNPEYTKLLTDRARVRMGYDTDRGTKDEDGVLEYRDVPPALSLSACHLAVDLREDLAAFLIPDVE